MRDQHPVIHGRQSWVAEPLRDELVGVARPALVGTGAAALLLLLIVCANIAGLSAARAVGLRQQFAVRAALGATSRRLFVERLADSLIVAGVGSAAGVWIAHGAVSVIAGFQQQFLDRISPITLDMTTTLLGLGAGLIAGIVAAVIPHGVGHRWPRPRRAPQPRGAAQETASATAIRSGFLGHRASGARAGADRGRRPVDPHGQQLIARRRLASAAENLITFGVNLAARYNTAEQQIQFERAVVDELRRIPASLPRMHQWVCPSFRGMGAALALDPASPRDAALA